MCFTLGPERREAKSIMIAQLFRKDCLLLLRSQKVLVSVLFFALLLVIIASFAFRQPGLGPGELKFLLPGIFWMVFLFHSTVTFHQLYQSEEENGALLGLLLSGIRPELIYLSKLLSTWLFLLFVQFVVIGSSVLFLGIGLGEGVFGLFLLTAVVAFGVSALGTLFATLSLQIRGRELLLPILLYPFTLPILLAAVTSSISLMQGTPFWQLGFPLILIGVFDVVSLALALLVFEPLVLD